MFSRYFHFKSFPPLSHTHESLTHALPLSSLHCSDPHTEPKGTTHTDAPRSKLDAAKLRSTPIRSRLDAAKLRSTPIRSRSKLDALDENHSDPLRSKLRSAHDPSSNPLHTGNETSSDPLQEFRKSLQSTPIQAPIQSTLTVSFLNTFLTPISFFSDPPLFLRSTVFPFLADNLISPIHKSSLPFSLRPTVMLVH